MARSDEILTDDVLNGIMEGLKQFADMLLEMAAYAEEKGRATAHPGQELYWGGFVEGLRTAALAATEVRPLRGIE